MGGDIPQEHIEVPGLLPDRHHVDHHGGEVLGLPQRPRNATALFKTVLHASELPGDGLVADGAGQDVHGIQDVHTARLQDGKNACKARDGGFLEERSKKRQPQQQGVADKPALLGPKVKI